MRVLVVEDQAVLADRIADGLRDQGMAADVACGGSAAIEAVSMVGYDVVVLDRDLPRVHGDAVCATIVAGPSPARILMLTAAAAVESRVNGLNLGADDYLTKPFAFAEVAARVRARGDLVLDRARRRASRGGRALSLTRKEFGVLEALVVADGAVVSAPRCCWKASTPSATS